MDSRLEISTTIYLKGRDGRRVIFQACDWTAKKMQHIFWLDHKMTIPTNREAKRWLYFDKFKMLLHHNKVKKIRKIKFIIAYKVELHIYIVQIHSI